MTHTTTFVQKHVNLSLQCKKNSDRQAIFRHHVCFSCLILVFSLHSLGFVTWYGKVYDLATSYGIDLEANHSKLQIKHIIRSTFIRNWYLSLGDLTKSPILRTYSRIKDSFYTESYLKNVKDPRHRIAITKLRSSSHTLEVERGRHTKPKTPLEERICSVCQVVEDEQHFIMECARHEIDRNVLFNKVSANYPDFNNKNVNDKFVFLLNNTDANIQNLVAKSSLEAFKTKAQVALLSG